jgi:hypothetical protein
MMKFFGLHTVAIALVVAHVDSPAPMSADALRLKRMAAVGSKGLEEAMNATKELTGFVKERLTKFLDKVSELEDGISKWTENWELISGEAMVQFRKEVAESTITLKNAKVNAKNKIKSIKIFVHNANKQLQKAFDATSDRTEKINKAIKITQKSLGLTLRKGATFLHEQEKMVAEAQKKFAVVQATSEQHAVNVQTALNGKSDFVQAKIDKWRTEAYAGCVASAILGPAGLIACYATAAGIVETNIKELNKTLEASKKTVTKFIQMFKDIGVLAKDLQAAATKEYNKLNGLSEEMDANADLINEEESRDWYESMVLDPLSELDEHLEKALAEDL